MISRISQTTSELETKENPATHDKWFHAQVQASINDPAPNIPHNQVITEMRALLESKQIAAVYSDCPPTDHTETIPSPPRPPPKLFRRLTENCLRPGQMNLQRYIPGLIECSDQTPLLNLLFGEALGQPSLCFPRPLT